MTRNRVGEDWPSKLTPIDLRVMLRPPSQPTRYLARMVFWVPSASSTVAVTPSASST